MEAYERRFIEQIALSDDMPGIVAACDGLEAGLQAVSPANPPAPEATPEFGTAMAEALYRHLSRVSRHAGFKAWLEVYFGRRPAGFRSRLQQPNYLYYPTLDPVAWFTAADLPRLAPLTDAIPAVRAELLEVLAGELEFLPYVDGAASGDRLWDGLAANPDWSALHLLRRDVWNAALMARLPATQALLDEAPLAQCPPHAPECFISRLRPGVVLPPHYGLSNIKLTVHLPIDLPPQDCSITVAGEARTWRHGEFLVFDDSFLHTAANHAERDRTVLIFDVWHPKLAQEECRALAHAVAALDRVQTAAGKRAAVR